MITPFPTSHSNPLLPHSPPLPTLQQQQQQQQQKDYLKLKLYII
jgi:hypothetical protein